MSTQRDRSTRKTNPTNTELAALLSETGNLLESQGANPFRVQAYRNAAEALKCMEVSVWRTVEAEGASGLIRFPAIGRSIAAALGHVLQTGKFPLLERLRGDDVAERQFATVAEIGPTLAQRIHEQLGIETLGELEAAALDGRLARVPGMGRKRVRAVRESLAGRFRSPPETRTWAVSDTEQEAEIGELLDVDRQYREAARKNQLPRIAPRRFNPTQEAWLPVLHTQRETRHYTAMFSNSAHAHARGTTHDWVVIYRDDAGNSGQWTVITSSFGKLRGKRIVRGRETDCVAHHASQIGPTTPSSENAHLVQQMLL